MTHRIRTLALVAWLSFVGSDASAQARALSTIPPTQHRTDDRARTGRQASVEFWRALGDTTLQRLVSETRRVMG